MTERRLDYKVMVTTALRDVVRQALEVVAAGGVPESHPLYVSFRTREAGVELPPELLDRYPEEMTIVFQHQFWDLEVERERFSVDMAFQGARYALEVPFAAVTAFSDPSVPFGLRFDPRSDPTADESEEGESRPTESEAAPEDAVEPVDNVIRFDRTRLD